jgi:hypothetical protein
MCIKIKLFLHAFQIYNLLLTEVNAKTMIRDQTQEHCSRNKMAITLSVFSSLISHYSFNNSFCEKIIIYLESLYHKLYADIKFIWKY